MMPGYELALATWVALIFASLLAPFPGMTWTLARQKKKRSAPRGVIASAVTLAMVAVVAGSVEALSPFFAVVGALLNLIWLSQLVLTNRLAQRAVELERACAARTAQCN